MADRYHETALSVGCRLVTACGMESVPPDLGAFLLAQHMRNKLGRWAGQQERVLAKAYRKTVALQGVLSCAGRPAGHLQEGSSYS